jgi:hypothetical protein
MNEHLHPDADQLTAFAEHALPAHEQQQVLVHLASCATCRSVVFLAQQAEPEVLPQPAAAARQPWFTSWKLAWTAAALAGIVVLSVHLRNATKPMKPTDVTSASLGKHSPVAVTASAALETSSPKPLSPASTAAVAGGRHTPASRLDSQMQPPLTTAAQPQVASPAAPEAKRAEPPNIVAMDQAAMAATAPAPAPPPLNLTDTSQQRTRLGSGPSQQTQPYQAVAGAPGQTVTVESNAAGMVLDGLAVESRNTSLLTAYTLPSRLAVRSSAASGEKVLAVDAAGSLFVSKDQGRHWKTVDAAWQGGVRQVRLAASPLPEAKMRTRVMDMAGAAPASAAPDAAAAAAGTSRGDRAEIAGTVTDASGASVPGATVRANSTHDGMVASTRADASGKFALNGLEPGAYRLQVTSPGFMTLTQELRVGAGDHANVPAVLQIAAAAETVTVTAGAAVVDAEKPDSKAPLFSLTTNTGETWISSDGQRWKRK